MKLIIKTNSPADNGLLITGIPLPKGILFDDGYIKCKVTGKDQPLWTRSRAWWTDGSIKWFMLHTRVPRGGAELMLYTDDKKRQGDEGKAVILNGSVDFGDMQLDINDDRWKVSTNGYFLELVSQYTDTDLDKADCVYETVLIEDSNIAPLIGIFAKKEIDGFYCEQQIRVDNISKKIIWTRRMTWNRQGGYYLCSAKALIRYPETDAEVKRLKIGSPLLTGERFIEEGISKKGFVLKIDKAWQRGPLEVVCGGTETTVFFYPPDEKPLAVSGGCSIRHEISICVCDTDTKETTGRVEYIIDPVHLCASGVFGPVKPLDQAAGYSPGFATAIRSVLDHSKDGPDDHSPEVSFADEKTHDHDHFGLLNYGDWPLKKGQYGSGDKRIYSDNEYDTPYSFFGAYAATGCFDYLMTARYSAIHMADIDCISMSGDMHYHDYGNSGDDHGHSRSNNGDPGHYWTDGLYMQYFFFGDLWSKKAADKLIDFLIDRYTSKKVTFAQEWAICERNLGWPLVSLAGAYESFPCSRTLEMMQAIVCFIAEYTKDPENWSLSPAIWRGAMRDGSKPFMTGIVLEGLERYHRMTGSEDAKSAIITLAGFLTDKMWLEHRFDFIYEYNAFGRAHRNIQAQYLIPLFLRGIGYAYEISGDNKFRDISEKAFHACLWTLFDQSGSGKEASLLTRSLGAYVSMLIDWINKDNEIKLKTFAISDGNPFIWNEGLSPLIKSNQVIPDESKTVFDGNALAADDTSFISSSFIVKAAADEGRISLRVLFNNTLSQHLNLRCLLHICGEQNTSSCVSVITFYTNLHVRFYDVKGDLIEVLEGSLSDHDIKGNTVDKPGYPVWEEGQWHKLMIAWKAPGKAYMYMDDVLADNRILDRPLGSGFKKLYIGYKPGNWKLHGRIILDEIYLGKNTQADG